MRLLLVILALFGPLLAEDDFVILQKDSVHEGDYFSSGKSIEISGIVKGDVYAFGSQIRIDGTVEGDVIASGGNIEITGTVMGNARLAAAQVELGGTIARNVTIIAGNLEMEKETRIGKNAILTAGVLDYAGMVEGNLTLTATTARFLGRVQGNVRAYVGTLRFGSNALIGGNLEYSSSEQALFAPGAQIDGEVTYHASKVGKIMKGEWKKGVVVGTKFTGALMNFLFSFVIAWLFLRFLPRKFKGTLSYLEKQPWKSFWIGLATFILLPVACLILFITILGFPIALGLLAAGLFTFYSAKIFPIFWLCNKVLPRRKNSLLIFGVGLLAFLLISHVPVFGGIIRMVFTLLGLGALVMGKMSRRHKPKKV